jgi:hypothetical protein
MIVTACAFSFGIAATTFGRLDFWTQLFIIGSIITIVGLIIRLYSIFTLGK